LNLLLKTEDFRKKKIKKTKTKIQKIKKKILSNLFFSLIIQNINFNSTLIK